MRMFHKLKQVEACLVRIDIPKLHTASQSAVIRICFARDKIKKKDAILNVERWITILRSLCSCMMVMHYCSLIPRDGGRGGERAPGLHCLGMRLVYAIHMNC